MKILLCPEKFKGSLKAHEVASSLREGIQCIHSNYVCIERPIADGGGGTLDLLKEAWDDAEFVSVSESIDPLNRPLTARYLVRNNVAFVELAEASGIERILDHGLNPLEANTYGTGQLIKHAIQNGCSSIYLMLGGSASTDMATGILHALGLQFLDKEGNSITELNGGTLAAVNSISSENIQHYSHVRFHILCDVNNPLYGKNGAAHIYGPQKGATPEQVQFLDTGLRHFSKLILEETGREVSAFPGSGAAGGVAAGLSGFFQTTIISGSETILKWLKIEDEIKNSDIVITGEGKFDEQSMQGKTINTIVHLTSKHRKPLYIVCGVSDVSNISEPIQAVHCIIDHASNVQDALLNPLPKLKLIGALIAQELKF